MALMLYLYAMTKMGGSFLFWRVSCMNHGSNGANKMRFYLKMCMMLNNGGKPKIKQNEKGNIQSKRKIIYHLRSPC